ncbi:hypothetical protein Vretifemale_20850 [Volvox reticuliferus]|uniref:AB hydrolase-1 domain-containing protein n=1 Tax=Volvox reticuliferus TaxID=1737510 RepID=A0A8J4D1X8_9CHLO|nr:hypothetical protein Vretifemale_20850 [Volvox reticuliferus]
MASPGQREGHMTAPAGAAATAPRTQSAENMPAAAAASSPAASGHKRVPVTAPLPPPMTTSHRESPEPSAPFQVSSVMVGRSGSSSTTTTSSLPSLSSLSSSSSTSGSVSTLRSSSPLVGGGSGNSASPPNPHPSPDAAPMLLLMHGLNGSTFSWRLLMDDLSAYVSPSTGGCRVVAYDRPPYGLSQRPLTWRREEDNPYTLAGGARLAAGLLDALLGPTPAQSAASGAAPGAAVLQQRASDVGKQAVLVGHSAGASVAVETALRYPERVCGLVLIAPAISTDPRGFLARADLGQLLRFAWTRSLLSVDGPGLHYVRRQVMKRKAEVEAGRLGLYADEREVPQEVIDGYLRPLRARDWDVGMLMAYRSLQVSGGPPHLEQLRVPVLVLQGREDRTVPMETAQAVAAALKRRQGAVTEVVVLEHCAHVPMDEQPLEVLSAIADFVNRHCCVLPP